MFRKIIIFLVVIVMISLALFISAMATRAVSLDVAFWWLIGTATVAAATMIIMAIDSERVWRMAIRARLYASP